MLTSKSTNQGQLGESWHGVDAVVGWLFKGTVRYFHQDDERESSNWGNWQAGGRGRVLSVRFACYDHWNSH